MREFHRARFVYHYSVNGSLCRGWRDAAAGGRGGRGCGETRDFIISFIDLVILFRFTLFNSAEHFSVNGDFVVAMLARPLEIVAGADAESIDGHVGMWRQLPRLETL